MRAVVVMVGGAIQMVGYAVLVSLIDNGRVATRRLQTMLFLLKLKVIN